MQTQIPQHHSRANGALHQPLEGGRAESADGIRLRSSAHLLDLPHPRHDLVALGLIDTALNSIQPYPVAMARVVWGWSLASQYRRPVGAALRTTPMPALGLAFPPAARRARSIEYPCDRLVVRHYRRESDDWTLPAPDQKISRKELRGRQHHL
jgi:hypothetical protein